MFVGRCSRELSGRKLHQKIKKSQTPSAADLSGVPCRDLRCATALSQTFAVSLVLTLNRKGCGLGYALTKI